MTRARALSLALLLAGACHGREPTAAGDEPVAEAAGGAPMTIQVTSPSFHHEGEIPTQFTCEGGDASPELRWNGVPPAAKSIALIVDDPDAPDPKAPKRTWVHWVLFDVPVSATGLPQGAAQGGLPAGTRIGKNDWGKAAWGGPCPPIGRHRYFFKVYALDTMLGNLGGDAGKPELERAMKGHVLAEGVLMGTYEKHKK
jgi:Raf kinase inhibitor-like YbhB/YbcL family protein